MLDQTVRVSAESNRSANYWALPCLSVFGICGVVLTALTAVASSASPPAPAPVPAQAPEARPAPDAVVAPQEPPPPAGGGGVPLEASVRIVSLHNVYSEQRQGDYYIKVHGEAPAAPAGTRVDFVLTWRSQSIETFAADVESDHQIRAEFKVKKIPRAKDKFMFRTAIHGHKQTAEVLAQIRRDTVSFPAPLDPWTDYHSNQKFSLVSSEAAEQLLRELAAMFEQWNRGLQALESSLSAASERAIGGEDFLDAGGRFSASHWQKWLEENVYSALREIQLASQRAFEEESNRPYRRALHLAIELSSNTATLAARTSERLNRELAKGETLESAPPKDLKLIGRRAPYSPRELDDLRAQIHRELRITPGPQIERPFEYVETEQYEGVVFRHLTAEERATGRYDEVRARATWTPSLEQIALLEEDLAKAAAHWQAKHLPTPGLRLMRRQYVGIEEAGERRVHCTFVHVRSPANLQLWHQVATPLREDPTHFSLQYRLDDQTFTANTLQPAEEPPK